MNFHVVSHDKSRNDPLLICIKEYVPGLWTTIALQMTAGVITFFTSMWFKRQNQLADEGKIPALEGVEGFRYVP